MCVCACVCCLFSFHKFTHMFTLRGMLEIMVQKYVGECLYMV